MIWAGLAVVCGVSAAIAYGLLDGALREHGGDRARVAGGAVLTELTTDLVPEGRLLAGPSPARPPSIGFAFVFGLVEVA